MLTIPFQKYLLTGLTLGSISIPSLSEETVQISLEGLLNARPVTTVANGKLVSWTEGLDGNYSGEATQAAGILMGDAVPKGLPDNGFFPATAVHPEVILHFSNAESVAKQVRRSLGIDTFAVAVPEGKYSRLSIFCMSANGSSNLTVQLIYKGEVVTRNLVLLDWYNELPAGDLLRYYLASDLAKWDKTNHKTEPNHHYLTGLDLSPDKYKVLTKIIIGKSAPGVLTFWGATGIREGATHLKDPKKPGLLFQKSVGLKWDGLGRKRSSPSQGRNNQSMKKSFPRFSTDKPEYGNTRNT